MLWLHSPPHPLWVSVVLHWMVVQIKTNDYYGTPVDDDDEGAKVAALSVCLFSARPGIIIGGDMDTKRDKTSHEEEEEMAVATVVHWHQSKWHLGQFSPGRL